MDKLYSDQIKNNYLTSLIRTVCNQRGGTGVDGYTCDNYAKDQLEEWGSSEEKLHKSIEYFKSLKINQLEKMI